MVRVKNRYLLVDILYPVSSDEQTTRKNVKGLLPDVVHYHRPTTDTLNPQALLKGIRAEVTALFGDYGSGAIAESLSGMYGLSITCRMSLIATVKYLSPATSTLILRVARAHYQMVWAALSMMTRVPVKEGKNCIFRVVRVSGTIRKAEEEAIRRAKDLILRVKRDAKGQAASSLNSMMIQIGNASSGNMNATKPSANIITTDDEDEMDTDD